MSALLFRTFVLLLLGIIVVIPLYGLVTGHLAEMMGGRMMVWGLAWALAVALIVVVAMMWTLARQWRRSRT
jgi:hypothetical protein